MFCPKCGSNQSEGKKFCTTCGTNLSIVSQALTGQNFQSNQDPLPFAPNLLNHADLIRQRELAKGFRFAIIGGGIVAFKLFSFVFSGPFRGGSPFGFWSFIGFVLLAIGVSKIISHRPHISPPGQPIRMDSPQPSIESNLQSKQPRPLFSSASPVGSATPHTSELKPARHPSPSVTEDDTQHLPK